MTLVPWPALFLVFLCSLFLSFFVKHLPLLNTHKPSKAPLPPSISILPILLHLVTHRGSLQGITVLLRRYHSLHGPILSLRLLPFAPPTIFISSSDLSHTALFKHADSFSNRPPPVEPTIFLTGGNNDISSSNHGSLWSILRRNLSSEILHSSSLRNFAQARSWAVQLLLEKLHSFAGREEFIPKQSFQHAFLSILALMWPTKLKCQSTRLPSADVAAGSCHKPILDHVAVREHTPMSHAC
ncbi:cytochrome P450 89A2-like [Phalaenopsis equestris]|uniref:cytochrome P450 89A2-like n=1 Tax=Phalaenopsis equestris TaxID=78828 RepID=UPI0009E2A619|nr:cytochrome P450 89A2-like [Phalaenopsis equestris]